VSGRSTIPEDVRRRLKLAPEGRNGPRPDTFTAADLMALELPEVRWAVPDIVPEGVTLLAGKPKLGKSWLTLALGVASATGGVALGTKRVEQGECLYLALEDNRRRLQKRLSKLLAGGDAPEGLHIALEWPRLDEGGTEALDEWLEARPDARLVVVDTLKKVRPRMPGNRNVYDVDYEALEPLLPLAAEHGVAIVVVHHTRKLAAADPLDEISGSTGLSGGVDGALVLKRDRGKADAYLHVTGRDIEEEQELALRWDPNKAGWCLIGDAEEHRRSEIRREIHEALADAGQPMGPKDVAAILEQDYEVVRQRLYQMSRDGEVRVVSRGRYAVAEHNNHNVHNKDAYVTDVMGGGDVTVPTEHSLSCECDECLYGEL
jgi:hypothetical protein